MNILQIIIPIGIAMAVLAAVGFVYLQKKDADSKPWIPPTPSGDNWVFQYSSAGLVGSPADFDFPSVGSVHYCVKNASGLSAGKTIDIKFTITGSGTLLPTEGDPPARLRLYFHRKGDTGTGLGEYQFYRFWSSAYADLVGPNQYSISQKLDPTLWGPVGGSYVPGPNYEQDKAAGFSAAMANADVLGFTFGGMFAGHGVYVKDGAAHFHLDSYSVS